MATTTHGVDLRAELGRVAERFEGRLRELRVWARSIPIDPGIRPDNITFLLPYCLAEAFPFDGDLIAARSMAIGNAFGAAHFLVQDRQLDGQEALSPAGLELSDTCLALFVREYARLFGPGGALWDDFDRYMRQYFESLAWEATVLGGAEGADAVAEEALPETLVQLGRRMAPLKTAGAATTALAGRPEELPAVERFVDEFHAGYQLADDIDDLEDDLERGRCSVVAWLIAREARVGEPASLIGRRDVLEVAVRSGALEFIIEAIHTCFRGALDTAEAIGSPSLEAHMRRLLNRSTSAHGRLLRRLRLALGPCTGAEGGGQGSATEDRARQPDAPPGGVGADPGVPRGAGHDLLEGVHAFTVGETSYVYDIASGLFFEADPLAASLLDWLESGAEPVDLKVLETDHGVDHVREGLIEIGLLRGSVDEISGARGLAIESPMLPSVSSVALHLTGRCNLSCDYCYLGTDGRRAPPMSEEVALRAVDLLFEESLGDRSVSVVFFGGEPLLRADLIERVVEHAEERVRSRPRGVSFHVTTNGTLLDREIASRLTALGVRILVSIDGPQPDHDRHRPFPDGRGSYEVLAARLRELPPGVRVGARATVTPESGHLVEIVSHLTELGCSVVHLAPVSGEDMPGAFAERLVNEFGELAHHELRRVLHGGTPCVGNFIDALASLETGRVRALPCGAGSRYLSVGADGALFLCHRFAGEGAYAVGDVFKGVDREKVRDLLQRLCGLAAGCAGCWARWLCGGPCFFDLEKCAGDSSGPGALRCAVRTRILELSMWLYASLPPSSRERVLGFGRGESGSESEAAPGHGADSAGEESRRSVATSERVSASGER